MPGSKQRKLALLFTLQFCGVATAYGDHDDYLQKLDAFANSPDPQLESGIASNDVFSIDVNGTFEEMIQGSTLFKYYAILDFINYPDGIFGDSFDRLLITTQEVHIDDNLEHIINDDLYNFTSEDMNLTGELLKAQSGKNSDQWEIIEFPAIMPSGRALWPGYWKKEELEKVKSSLSLKKWNAQWMQNPTSEEGAILKREWWRNWEKEELPPLEHVIQSYDTAFLKKETADYSAITTWGVFSLEDKGKQLILVDSLKGRYEFPELRRLALEQYKYWQPETVIVESKASGLPLTFELRRMGIPVVTFTPSKGNDKHARVNSVAPLFESGCIWAPKREEWAQEVIEECAAFPFGENDDLVDSTTQAVKRFREGGLINHPEDYEDSALPSSKHIYY